MSMKAIALEVDKREATGKGAARALRREGKLPAIVYGNDTAPVMITINQKDMVKYSNKSSFFGQIFELDIDGKKVTVLPKDLQRHPATDMPEHADFLQVSEDTRVAVSVKVVFLNQDKCPGVKRGGVLNIIRRELELSCTPASIPRKIEIDLSSYQIGDSIHISQVELPEGVAPTITDRDFTIAAITGRKAEKEESEDEEGVEGDDAAAEGEDTAEEGGEE